MSGPRKPFRPRPGAYAGDAEPVAPTDTAGARERRRMWQLAAVYGAFGIEIAACFVGGALAGHWSDTRFTPAPWGFLFGTVVGCGAAIKAVVRMVRLGRPR